MDQGDVLEQARKWVKAHKPQASAYKHAAFANAVQSLVTGWSGGYGGPSIREHIAEQLLGRRGSQPEGRYSFDEAIALLSKDDGLIFGPLRAEHYRFWRDQSDICFDDDPDDLRALEQAPPDPAWN